MENKPQNFSAFPCAAFGPEGEDIHQRGMSMRDWFAGMALQGMVKLMDEKSAEQITELCYSLSDMMMEVRGVDRG